MSSAVSLHPYDRKKLLDWHLVFFDDKAWKTKLSVLAAAFLVTGALIVIGSSCLCLTLPGVNVMSQVILPGILPGTAALLLGIPFIIYSVRKAIEKNAARKEQIDWYTFFLIGYFRIYEMDEEKAADFILENFFNLDDENWTPEYRSKIIGDIKEYFPTEEKNQDPEQKIIVKALDKALEKVLGNKKSEKK